MARSLSLFLLLLCNFSATEDDATRLESNELTDRRIASRRVADDYIERMSGALLWTPKGPDSCENISTFGEIT